MNYCNFAAYKTLRMNNQFSYPKERIRTAIFTFFFAQGLCFSSWASRIPNIKETFESMDLFYWGVILFMIPVGKFVAIPLAGYLVSRLGSRRIVQMSILGYAAALILIGLALNIYVLGFCLFCFGIFWNLCDISFNTQGIEVERIYGKTIMATFHGGWSLGACFGALVGFFMILLNITPIHHFLIISVVILFIVFMGYRYLQESTPVLDDSGENESSKINGFFLLFRKPEKLLLIFGTAGLFGLIVESAMFDWSGTYFQTVLQVPKTLQIGFLVFMVMMTTGRFLTNYAYSKIGKRNVLILAGSLIFVGFYTTALLGKAFDSVALKVIFNSLGFMLVGLGISSVVPTIYSFVGTQSKTPVGVALTILSSISFIGSLIAPLLIGAISQRFSMSTAYLIVGLLGLCIVLIVATNRNFREKKE